MQISLSGRFFFNLDRICTNFKLFIRRHTNTTDIIFLMLYVLLQILLVLSISLFGTENIGFIISLFVILFLFLVSLERIVLQFRFKQAQEDKDEIQRQYFELKSENKVLRERKKDIIERAEFVIGGLVEDKKKLKQQR
jgi:hypothetical protein